MIAASVADVTALLDQLDAAREAIGDSPAFRVTEFVQDEEQVLAQFDDGGASVFAECYGADAAALIVAAVNALPALLAAVRAGLALHQPAGPCTCGGRRWVKDEGWSPEDYERNSPRTEGSGLIPCGFCNFGGWNTEQYAPGGLECECGEPAPCPTASALTEPLAGQHTTDGEGR